MELSFAIQRSKEKSCGVCFETIMEKSSREQRFGILPNCNHCFCLSCIRKWRQAKQFDNKIIRACPECRIPSDFVCPSMYWVDTKEEKEKLIRDYKGALRYEHFNRWSILCLYLTDFIIYVVIFLVLRTASTSTRVVANARSVINVSIYMHFPTEPRKMWVHLFDRGATPLIPIWTCYM